MTKRSPFKYFKTSPEIIRLAVMLYVRLPLSPRNVEDLLHERGVEVSHEAVRYWWHRFGPIFASEIRKRRIEGMRSSHWRWHLDEMFVKINGERHYLWCAVDHEGEVLESFVTKTRDKKAALKFLRKTMKKHGSADAFVTDRLRSYGAAMKELGLVDRQEAGRWLNNRVENSHLPFRRRERAMLRFRRMRSLQKFSAVQASVYNLFNTERSLSSRPIFKLNRTAALAEWRGLCAESSGAVSALNKGQLYCPCRDEFELVWQHHLVGSERATLRFQRVRSLQKFSAVHAPVYNLLNSERSLISRSNFKMNCAAALTEWSGLCAITGSATAHVEAGSNLSGGSTWHVYGCAVDAGLVHSDPRSHHRCGGH